MINNDDFKVVEFFAGSQSFTKVAAIMGFRTCTSDILPLPGIDIVKNILDVTVADLPFIPDVVWASPDCAAWSKAAGNTHFDKNYNPKTEKAAQAEGIVKHTLELIAQLLKLNPALLFYIENPEGRLGKIEMMKPGSMFSPLYIPRKIALSQCKYGREFRKNTHIWTNDLLFIPLPMCRDKTGECHLKNAKNSEDLRIRKIDPNYTRSPGGDAWKKSGYYQRALIPPRLCEAFLKSAFQQITKHEYNKTLSRITF